MSKSDLEELGEGVEDLADGFSKYAKELQALTGFSILKEGTTNQFKDLYDIMDGIAKKWDQLTDTQQARVAEILGGTRQLQVIASIMGNWGDAVSAYQTAINSAGAATKANDIYMETAAAHIQQFKAAFQELSSNIINSKAVSFVIDIGTAVLSVANALAKLKLLFPAIIAAMISVKGVRSAIAAQNILPQILAEKGMTESLAISVRNLTAAQRERLIQDVNAAVAAGNLSTQEGAQIVTTISLAGANQTLATSFKALAASIPVWGWIAIGVSVLITAITALSSAISSSEEKIKEADNALIELSNHASEMANNFKSTKQSVEDLKDRFAILAGGVTRFGENVSLTADEYSEFLEVNNKLAELFPDLVAGYDSEGNAILKLSYDITTITEALDELLERERELANQELVGDMSDSVKRAREATSEISKEINDYQAIIEAYQRRRSNFNDPSLSASAKESLRSEIIGSIRGGNVIRDVPSVADYALLSDASSINDQEVNNIIDEIIARYTRMYDVAREKFEKKWNRLNPTINAYVHINPDYQELPVELQSVIDKMISGLDLGAAGLQTDTEIKRYIDDYIVTPIAESSPEIRKTFAQILDWKELYSNGELSDTEFADNIRNAYTSLYEEISDDEWADDFINAMNSAGYAGEDFGSVVDAMIVEWMTLKRVSENSSSVGSRALKEFSNTVSQVKSSYDLLSKAQKDMGGEEYGGGLSPDTIKALADAEDNYLDYLYEENGVIKLNTEAWEQYSKSKVENTLRELESENALLLAKREELRLQLEELIAQRGNGVTSTMDSEIQELSSLLDINSKSLEENGRALELWQTILNSIAGTDTEKILSPFERATSTFSDVASELEKVNSEFKTLAEMQVAVGDSFRLSQEEALKYATVYPEILNNATIAANGELQLNEDVVNDFIRGKRAELEASIQTKIDELTIKKQMLQAVQNYAKSELEIAQKLASGEAMTDAELTDLRNENKNKLTQALIALDVQQANANKIASEAMAGNYSEVDRIAAEVAKSMSTNMGQSAVDVADSMNNNMYNVRTDLSAVAKQAYRTARAIKNMKNGVTIDEDGNVEIVRGSGGGAGYSSSSSTISSGSFKGMSDTYQYVSVELQNYIKQIQAEIDSYTDAINNIDGQISLLEALKEHAFDIFKKQAEEAAKDKSSGKSGKSGSGSSSSSSGDNWFEAQYKLYQHLLNMDQAETEDYLKWLDWAYQEAYRQGIITLEDYFKY